MHFSKKLPHNAKLTFETRKNTSNVFQNISNIILALIWVLIISYLQRLKNRPQVFSRRPCGAAQKRMTGGLSLPEAISLIAAEDICRRLFPAPPHQPREAGGSRSGHRKAAKESRILSRLKNFPDTD
jgi:hypothetical protein